VTRAVVFGGYGVFGAHVCRELGARGIAVTVAGRDAARAESFARTLGRAHHGIGADVRRADDCRRAIDGHAIAVCCAGPFSALGPALVEACLDARCHYVDIADDRGYVALVRARGKRFREKGRAAVFGCSSLPGLSTALALRARERVPAPEHARVGLYIGHDNPKGVAVVTALVERLGQPFSAPQGVVRSFRGGEGISVPPEFRRRRFYPIDAPEYDLLPDVLGVRRLFVGVTFERREVTLGFAALARAPGRKGARIAGALTRLARLAPRGGSSGGAVLAELRAGTAWAQAAVVAARDGQRMAALPCALAAAALAEGRVSATGALGPWDLLGPAELLAGVAAGGFTVVDAAV
jgi:hypothetical protein